MAKRAPISKLFVAVEEGLAIFEYVAGRWRFGESLQDAQPQVVATDPSRSERVYCGTFSRGLWVSGDGGETWDRDENLASLSSEAITSLAVNPKSIFVGTEPSRIYRSKDTGQTWDRLVGLEGLPSSKTWSFPPRPSTHHVRTIVCNPVKTERVYAAIEAGALVRSFDCGTNWKDKVRGGPYDTHNLAVSRSAPGKLYSSAGDGYFESDDYGETWRRETRGLKQTYMYSVAVHPSDPNTVLVSCSSGPWSAYNSEYAESHVYRRTLGEESWKEVTNGLPEPGGTTASFLVPNEESVGEFYACNNKGAFVSRDAGLSWENLGLPWKDQFKRQHVSHVALG